MKDKRKWTQEEDDALLRGLEAELAQPTGRANSINWNEIAKRVPARNNKDCRKRYVNGMAMNLRKGPWSLEEDQRLRRLIGEYGTSWVDVARVMGSRSADQCSKRWYHCLNPDLDRQPWKNNEIHLLMEAYKTHGSSWKLIQERYLPSRSPNNIRNQYTILTRSSSRSGRSSPKASSDVESSPALSSRALTSRSRTMYNNSPSLPLDPRLAVDPSPFSHQSYGTADTTYTTEFESSAYYAPASTSMVSVPLLGRYNEYPSNPVDPSVSEEFAWLGGGTMLREDHSRRTYSPSTYSMGCYGTADDDLAMLPATTGLAPEAIMSQALFHPGWTSYDAGQFSSVPTAGESSSWGQGYGISGSRNQSQMGYVLGDLSSRR